MLYEKVYSFDCAWRTLGFISGEINIEVYADLQKCYMKYLNLLREEFDENWTGELFDPSGAPSAARLAVINEMGDVARGFFKLNRIECVDVLAANYDETDHVYRARALRSFLESLDLPDLVLIEKQPNVRNTKSSEIQAQLLLWFSNCEVELIDPNSKNNISLGVSYQTFLGECDTTYKANKLHSISNMLKFWEDMGWSVDVLPMGKLDDVADSFMQLIVYAKNTLGSSREVVGLIE